MKFTTLVFFTLFMIASAFAGDSINQVGYFKDKNRNRIFTFSLNSSVTEQEIQKHALNLPNTDGRMTAAYYYIEGSVIPSDGLTLAGNVLRANNMLFETPGLSKWKYAYMVSLKGERFLINCDDNPKDGLCRQK